MTKRRFISLLLAALSLLTLPQFSSSAAAEPTVLVTGSNRGIGLEIARIYAERGWNVIATARTPDSATELQAIAAKHKNLVAEQLDVADDASIAALAAKYKGKPIDILLNNAGIGGDRKKQNFGKFDYDLYNEVMNVNVLGPLKMAEAFITNVEASNQKKIINISSTQGSVASTRTANRGGSYFYKASKSSLNMVMNILALELKDRGVTVGLVSPGWVDTNFGGLPSLPGMIKPEESAKGVVAQIDQYDIKKTGLIISHDGKEVAW